MSAKHFCRHLGHWTIWNKWDLYNRSIEVYNRFLPSSYDRAKHQGYKGARIGKMSDPSGRSAPGEINSLLIWQQPHPVSSKPVLGFDYEYVMLGRLTITDVVRRDGVQKFSDARDTSEMGQGSDWSS